MKIRYLTFVGLAVIVGACASSARSDQHVTTSDLERPLDVAVERNRVAVMAKVNPFVGRTLEEFSSEAMRLGYKVYVIRRDGVSQGVNFDYQAVRVNVVVEDARVVSIFSIG